MGADARDRRVCRSTDRRAVQCLLLLANTTDTSVAHPTDAASASDALAVRHVSRPLKLSVFTPQATNAYFTKFSASVATDRHTIESSSWQKIDRRVRCSTDRRWPASVATVSLIRERQTRLSLDRARV
jgi:hypothetical protein